jgi:hypothetical protein
VNGPRDLCCFIAPAKARGGPSGTGGEHQLSKKSVTENGTAKPVSPEVEGGWDFSRSDSCAERAALVMKAVGSFFLPVAIWVLGENPCWRYPN